MVSEFVARLKKMRIAHLIPVVVFDSVGATSADKSAEAAKRKAKREAACESWMEMDWDSLTQDQQADHEAEKKKCLQAALIIKPALVWKVITALRHEGCSYFVSPAEADHQLVHLVKTGVCKCALTIDGDT